MKSVKLVATAMIIAAASIATPAEAAITSVTEDYSAPFGTYGGRTYVYKEVTLKGTVDRPDPMPDATYSVGMVLIYPTSNGNGVTFVEWVNTIFFYRYNSICPRKEPFCDAELDGDLRRRLEDMVIRFAIPTFEDHLWNEGYTYSAVLWDKTVADFFGETPPTTERHNRLAFGRIDKASDAEEILADAARFAKNPTPFFQGVPPATKVIGFGYSQPSCLQQTFLIGGKNNPTLYDGMMLGQIGLLCWEYASVNQAPHWTRYGELTACSGPIAGSPGGAKVMVITSQTDMEIFFGAFARATDPNYIQYELAGIAHIPLPVLDTSVWGATKPNPADSRPFYRGALTNLTKWVKDGTAPPVGAPMQGTLDTTVNPPTWTTMLDADGNAVGGIRLPHMPTTIGGQPAGAPTGTYTGFDPGGFSPVNIFYLLAGTYKRFTDAELMTRYPTVAAYKALITRSADQLLADRFITQKDRDAYIAGTPDLPNVPEEMEPPVEEGDAGCCETGSSGTSPFVLSLIVGVMLFPRRRSRRSLARYLVVGLLVAIAALASGCGDNVDPNRACVGHACPNATINLPEGGEVRFEIAYLKDYAPEIRTAIWFASAQSPASRPWPRPPTQWNQIPRGSVLCSDMRKGNIWPSGDPQSRTYVDVGATVTLSGGGKDFVFNREMNVEDNAYRNVSDIGYSAQIEPADVPLGTEFAVELGNGDSFTPGVYLPPDYDMQFPNMADTVLVPRDKDFPFLWTPPAAPDDFMFTFVSFNDQIDPMVFCIGRNSGQMVVPKDFINVLPPGGSILHGVLEHRVVPNSDGTRRIDLLGVNCRYGQYVITDSDL